MKIKLVLSLLCHRLSIVVTVIKEKKRAYLLLQARFHRPLVPSRVKNGKQLVSSRRLLHSLPKECHSIVVLLLEYILQCILIEITKKLYGKGYQHEAGAHDTLA